MLTTATHIINTQLDIINKAIVIRDQNGVFIHYDPEQILLAFRRSNVLETELERAKRQRERERERERERDRQRERDGDSRLGHCPS